jgi:hypothetical protein
MVTEENAAKLMIDGMVAVCAWCEHLHEAKGKGLSSCEMEGCGGPAALKSFPRYKGPMESSLAKMCYLCGQEADFGAMLNGRMLGVCNRTIPGNEKTGLTCALLFRKILESRQAKITEQQASLIG